MNYLGVSEGNYVSNLSPQRSNCTYYNTYGKHGLCTHVYNILFITDSESVTRRAYRVVQRQLFLIH